MISSVCQSFCTHLIFFFTATATTEIYTLSLHDALPIWMDRLHVPQGLEHVERRRKVDVAHLGRGTEHRFEDRKSTRLNSSHPSISYAVFCLKIKKTNVKTKPKRKPTSSVVLEIISFIIS